MICKMIVNVTDVLGSLKKIVNLSYSKILKVVSLSYFIFLKSAILKVVNCLYLL